MQRKVDKMNSMSLLITERQFHLTLITIKRSYEFMLYTFEDDERVDSISPANFFASSAYSCTDFEQIIVSHSTRQSAGISNATTSQASSEPSI